MEASQICVFLFFSLSTCQHCAPPSPLTPVPNNTPHPVSPQITLTRPPSHSNLLPPTHFKPMRQVNNIIEGTLFWTSESIWWWWCWCGVSVTPPSFMGTNYFQGCIWKQCARTAWLGGLPYSITSNNMDELLSSINEFSSDKMQNGFSILTESKGSQFSIQATFSVKLIFSFTLKQRCFCCEGWTLNGRS